MPRDELLAWPDVDQDGLAGFQAAEQRPAIDVLDASGRVEQPFAGQAKLGQPRLAEAPQLDQKRGDLLAREPVGGVEPVLCGLDQGGGP